MSVSLERLALTDVDIMDALLEKIYQYFTFRDDDNPTMSSQSPYISFINPGMGIGEKDVDFNIYSDVGDLEAKDRHALFSQMVNSIPESVGFWQSTDIKVWDIYQKSITNIKLASSQLTTDEKKLLEKCEKIITSTNTKKYLKYQNLYLKAKEEFTMVRLNALRKKDPASIQIWEVQGERLILNKNFAFKQWVSEGLKNKYEEAIATIGMLTERGPNVIYDNLKSRFQESFEKTPGMGLDFYHTYIYPPKILSSEYSDRWVEFSFEESERHEYNSQSSTSYGGGGGFSTFGFSWSAGASYSRDMQREQCEIHSQGFSIKASFLQVPIIRPWYSSYIYKSRGWKWVDEITTPISTGSIPPNEEVFMPIVPNSIIFAKDIEVTFNKEDELTKKALDVIKGKGSVGFGPFSIRGNYSHTSSSSSLDYEETNTGIKSTGIQLFAFVCDVIPKSPNPDPKLFGEAGFVKTEENLFSGLNIEPFSIDQLTRFLQK
ncbi:hypothetical protein NST50_24520 [Paenibacillus sp. FSL E2-0202]|jgi:hypothetical protein|uniref:hypothetical protein n=1 Tax=unclassified Paenibacillus TaxID=185978 RepID=UPI0030ED1953